MEQSVPKRRHIKFGRRWIEEENIQHSEHGESLKSRIVSVYSGNCTQNRSILYFKMYVSAASNYHWVLKYYKLKNWINLFLLRFLQNFSVESLLRAFANFSKKKKDCSIYRVCLSVRMEETRLPLDEFSEIWYLTNFSTICRRNSSFIET